MGRRVDRVAPNPALIDAFVEGASSKPALIDAFVEAGRRLGVLQDLACSAPKWCYGHTDVDGRPTVRQVARKLLGEQIDGITRREWVRPMARTLSSRCSPPP
ncbi:hypothetical protein [Streptomyces mexicanus]|uniref:hypothetical protein n=1 Tax=Streptomyces mexicanus TaxID=178566 RepID=UPI0036652D4C